MKKQFKNATELVEFAKKEIEAKRLDPIFKVIVEHNPNGRGGKTELYAKINNGYLSTFTDNDYLNQSNIDGVDYEWGGGVWEYEHKGEITLILPNNETKKPEVYEVGDTVLITEEAKKCGNYEDWNDKRKETIGKKYKIEGTYDNGYGVSYIIKDKNGGDYTFPHYCCQKVETETVEVTLEQIAEKFGVDVDKIKIKE